MGKELVAPVLFLIFNQPAITARTFEEIRKAKPKRLFISADGPRAHRIGEAEACQNTRDIVIKNIDWECEVTTRFLETNLGCKLAVSSAITWFLNQVEEGIILEYDCVPSQSFFWFCQELLEKYRDDKRVMAINGSNFMFGQKVGDASYYFSKLPCVWGWATWKRAWEHWDGELTTFPRFKEENVMASIFRNNKSDKYWVSKFEQVYHKIDKTWGHPWCYAVFLQNGICATANVNLVSNIGFSPVATHATDLESRFANIPRFELDEITHQMSMVPNLDADESVTCLAAYQKPVQRVAFFVKEIALRVVPASYHDKIKLIYRKMRHFWVK